MQGTHAGTDPAADLHAPRGAGMTRRAKGGGQAGAVAGRMCGCLVGHVPFGRQPGDPEKLPKSRSGRAASACSTAATRRPAGRGGATNWGFPRWMATMPGAFRARTLPRDLFAPGETQQGRWRQRCADTFPWAKKGKRTEKLFGAYVEKKLNNQAWITTISFVLARDDADEALARDIGENWDHCWWTSTRTQTCCRRRSCSAAALGRGPDGGGRRRAVDLFVPRRFR